MLDKPNIEINKRKKPKIKCCGLFGHGNGKKRHMGAARPMLVKIQLDRPTCFALNIG